MVVGVLCLELITEIRVIGRPLEVAQRDGGGVGALERSRPRLVGSRDPFWASVLPRLRLFC